MNNFHSSINIIKYTFPNIAFVNFVLTLREELKNCDSILDIGCGSNSPLKFIHGKYKYGIDGHSPSIKESKKRGIHDKYSVMDISEIKKKFMKNQFDAVVALDVIEHLSKQNGYKLLRQMERIAAKKVIVFTPNGFVPQIGKDNHLQEHISGWEVGEFAKRGYEVSGMYGLKVFRGEGAELRFKPKIITGIVSEITQHLFVHNRPEKSFSLFTVYNKE